MAKKWLLHIFLLLLPVAVHAQDLEYEVELGGALGACSYLGDISSSPLSHLGAMGGVVGRKNLNQRMVLKGNLYCGHISGDSKGFYIPTDVEGMTPEGGEPASVKFQKNLLDLGVQYEQNFWGYGLGAGYKELSRITPYATIGLGFTLAFGSGNTNVALNVPVGLGVKYKIMPRVNVGAEWTVRFTTTDKLDVTQGSKQLDAPYGIQSSGFKNMDCYSCLLFSVTYDLCPKLRKCNN